jgi:farnesyl diphosphate synthase
MTEIQTALAQTADLVDRAISDLLPDPEGPEARVMEAMRYAMLSGGKRFRPLLILESGRLFGIDRDAIRRVAVAVECVHTFSLVHDDLPCMDDDDLRRGRPSTHKEFDEATAVLAGDALLTFAFELLSDEAAHRDPFARCELVTGLARAVGCQGMIGGQMVDLQSENKQVDMSTITRLHRLKTGALIAFSCEAGAIMGRAAREPRHALDAYAHDLGLAFQIADDILDVEGTSEELGKTAGKDQASGKATFVSILGLDRAKSQAQMLAEQAGRHLDVFDERADLLRAIPEFVVTRKS